MATHAMFWMLTVELNKVGFCCRLFVSSQCKQNNIFLLGKTHEEIYLPAFGLFHET